MHSTYYIDSFAQWKVIATELADIKCTSNIPPQLDKKKHRTTRTLHKRAP